MNEFKIYMFIHFPYFKKLIPSNHFNLNDYHTNEHENRFYFFNINHCEHDPAQKQHHLE